jgi:hypothetical protein
VASTVPCFLQCICTGRFGVAQFLQHCTVQQHVLQYIDGVHVLQYINGWLSGRLCASLQAAAIGWLRYRSTGRAGWLTEQYAICSASVPACLVSINIYMNYSEQIKRGRGVTRRKPATGASTRACALNHCSLIRPAWCKRAFVQHSVQNSVLYLALHFLIGLGNRCSTRAAVYIHTSPTNMNLRQLACLAQAPQVDLQVEAASNGLIGKHLWHCSCLQRVVAHAVSVIQAVQVALHLWHLLSVGAGS